MTSKLIKTDFGQFTFLDDHTVVATANEGVNIGEDNAQRAIDLIEKELPGRYSLILNRKNDYSVSPIAVYKYFASIKRLYAIAIVSHSDRKFLPDQMEQRIFKGKIAMFSSIEKAHAWINALQVEYASQPPYQPHEKKEFE